MKSSILKIFSVVNKPVKKVHLLRCAQSSRFNVPGKYACARRFIARLASEAFLTGLKSLE
jgi:hypothetical protein